jgi:hypothetical protein
MDVTVIRVPSVNEITGTDGYANAAGRSRVETDLCRSWECRPATTVTSAMASLRMMPPALVAVIINKVCGVAVLITSDVPLENPGQCFR